MNHPIHPAALAVLDLKNKLRKYGLYASFHAMNEVEHALAQDIERVIKLKPQKPPASDYDCATCYDGGTAMGCPDCNRRQK